ncbi:MAG: hypothetical protein NT175_04185 [Bacteroidetes bacterium]|nr:hypothetical protein [Bacteroidota bacterium]
MFKSYNNLFKGYEYRGLPFASELIKYKKALEEYYSQYQASYSGVNGDSEFEKYLINKLAEYTDRNTFNNDLKSKFLYISKRYLFIAIVSLVLSFIPFLFNLFNKPDKSYQIEIKNIEALNKHLLNFENYDRRTDKSNITARGDTTTSSSTTSSRQDN